MPRTDEGSAEGTIEADILLPIVRVRCTLIRLEEDEEIGVRRLHLLQDVIDERIMPHISSPDGARSGHSVLAGWLEPIPQCHDSLQRFHGHETIVLLLDVWQRGIRHQTGVLLLAIIPRRPIGPTSAEALARPCSCAFSASCSVSW